MTEEKWMTLSFAEREKLRMARYGPKKTAAQRYEASQLREVEEYNKLVDEFARKFPGRTERYYDALVGR